MSTETQKHIQDAWVCLRENNNTIPSDLLDEFKYILSHYYNGKDNVIVPKESAKFCADKTLAYMQEQKATWGENADLEAQYLMHAGNVNN